MDDWSSFTGIWMQVPIFILAQISGSILASLNLRILFHNQPDIRPAVTQVVSPYTPLQAVFWEYTITFILTIISSAVATDSRAVWSYNHPFLEIKIHACMCLCTYAYKAIDFRLENDEINSTKCSLELQSELRWCSTLSLPGNWTSYQLFFSSTKKAY